MLVHAHQLAAAPRQHGQATNRSCPEASPSLLAPAAWLCELEIWPPKPAALALRAGLPWCASWGHHGQGHTCWLQWIEAYPNATSHVCPGGQAKLKDIPYNMELSRDNQAPAEWLGEIEPVFLGYENVPVLNKPFFNEVRRAQPNASCGACARTAATTWLSRPHPAS